MASAHSRLSDNSEIEGLVVIGAGLMRTGTNSLKVALEILLQRKCYHMKELASHRHHIDIWIRAFEEKGNLSDDDWRALFSEFGATVDYPGAPFYAELMRVYPQAKVILSVREPHSWVRSVRETVAKGQDQATSFPGNLFFRVTGLRRFGELVNKFGPLLAVPDEDQASMKMFQDWTKKVTETVPSEKLLIYEVGTGWDPLCTFLGIPVPLGVPYPHVNDRTEMRNRLLLQRSIGYGLVIGLPSLLAFIGWRVYTYAIGR